MTHSSTFADVFPAANEAQWRKAVERVLKDAPFESLIGSTADGIEVQPLYGVGHGPRALRAKAGDWAALTRIDLPDLEAAGQQVQADLEGGATGLHLVFADANSSHGTGLAPGQIAGLRGLWAGIPFERSVRVELELGAQSLPAASSLAQYLAAEGIAPNLVQVGFGLDPLGLIARHGGGADWTKQSVDFARDVTKLAAYGFGGTIAAADGSLVAEAGGTEAQELAFILANALSQLKALEHSGVGLDAARKLIGFRVSADADQFLTIAKIRALRQLWARIEEACGLVPAPIDIFAKSSWSMMSKADPWVNVLRTGMACFAAGIGSADAVSLMPLTQALGLPDGFARRLARNTQLILLQESHLGHVRDAAGGAGGFEALTAELAQAAWAKFQEIEAEGGLFAALTKGHFQAQVTASCAAKRCAYKEGKAKLIGVSIYRNKEETPVAVLAPLAAEPVPVAHFAPLIPVRFAESFDA